MIQNKNYVPACSIPFKGTYTGKRSAWYIDRERSEPRGMSERKNEREGYNCTEDKYEGMIQNGLR